MCDFIRRLFRRTPPTQAAPQEPPAPAVLAKDLLYQSRQYATQRTSEFEGCELKPYTCTVSNRLHIGFGRNIEDMGISPDEAERMLHNDMDTAVRELLATFREFDPESSLFNLNEQQVLEVYSRFPVLLDLLYNLGLTRFLTFKKMIAAIREQDWVTASKELMDSRYAQQVPIRAKNNARWLQKGRPCSNSG